MKKRLVWALILGAFAAIGMVSLAIAREKPVIVRAGKLVFKINGGVTPKALPKHRLAPIAFHGGGTLWTVDGSHPPALEEVVLDADRNVLIDVRGLPSCRREQLVALNTRDAIRACPDAVLGKGSSTVRVAFPDQTPFEATGSLLLFNGGVKGGVSTFFLHAYVAVPTPTAVVATGKVTRVKGRLGNHMVFSVPLIAGGSGSVIHTHITIPRRPFTYKGRRKSFLSARCLDGRFLARGTFKFRDGTQLTGSVVRRCQATG